MPPRDPQTLSELLERLRTAAEGDERVSVGHMVEAVGQRSFGVLLLVPGLLVLSPLSGIPGLPSVFAVMVVLITLQLLIGRERFWLPRWLLARSASRGKYLKALGVLDRLARVVDRLLKPRLEALTRGIALRLCGLLCILIALTMPPLELIPFGNSTAGAALSILGLGLMARDGAMVLAGLGFFLLLVWMLRGLVL